MLFVSLIPVSLLCVPTTLATMPIPSPYENTRIDWISPYFVLTHRHSKSADQGRAAINLILHNATDTLHRAPPTVLHDPALSPDGSSRSYVSFAPYWWPDCCQRSRAGQPSTKSPSQSKVEDDGCKGSLERFQGFEGDSSGQKRIGPAQKTLQRRDVGQSARHAAFRQG